MVLMASLLAVKVEAVKAGRPKKGGLLGYFT